MTSWSTKYLGKSYKTLHPCMALVLDVLHNEYGIKASLYDEPLNLEAKRALAYKLLSESCQEIPRHEVMDGDIVLINVAGVPAHVGIMLNSKNVMHVPNDRDGVVIEPLDSPYIRNRIAGFYRPVIKDVAADGN